MQTFPPSALLTAAGSTPMIAATALADAAKSPSTVSD